MVSSKNNAMVVVESIQNQIIQRLGDFEKSINIEIDGAKITKDINLVLSFEKLPVGGDYEDVAWRVSPVPYSSESTKTVPVQFKSTLGFSIASKLHSKTIIPGAVTKMDLQDSITVVMKGEEKDFGDRTKKDKKLKPNQVSACNNADTRVALSVGFVNTDKKFESVAYIGDLENKMSWVATYTPNMSLYITSDMDAKSSDVLSTIAKSPVVYTWNLASPAVEDESNWLLTLDDKDTYVINKDSVKRKINKKDGTFGYMGVDEYIEGFGDPTTKRKINKKDGTSGYMGVDEDIEGFGDPTPKHVQI